LAANHAFDGMFSSNLKKSSFFNRFLIWLISIVSLIVGAVVARWIFHEAGYGFDFQDESFALLVAENPREYLLLPSRIGFFLKPFYEMAGRDIPLLGQFSYLLLAFGLYLNFLFAWRMPADATVCFAEKVCLF
jgi:hypothetical protein